jgi:hypothetical protein
MADEELYLPIKSRSNRTYIDLLNEYGKVLPTQVLFFATSGAGKGLAVENFVEEWRRVTKGIVLIIADPKNEAEFSFVQYEPMERYHLDKLRRDGKPLAKYSCKLYHPFTFNLPKGFLPDIDFFTVPLKTLTREDWTILSETSYDSESIRLLMTVSQELSRNDGLFSFLHQIQKRVQGKKDKRKAVADPKNFYLSVGGGTSKSITEIAGLLNPFKINYFLRKENCPFKLDWQKILTDNENYHVFLSMWLKDDKLQEFMVLNLLKQIINNRQYAKKPILIVIPELMKLCPRNPQGYKYFLSNAISEALVTIRSMGRGISFCGDSQNWGNTDDKVKGSAGVTFFGQLSTKDQETVCKALNYKRDIREKLAKMDKNSFYKYGQEDYDPMKFWFPGHAHKEPEYNWIEMYSKFFYDKTKRYDELVRILREEFDSEEKEVRLMVEKQIELEEQEDEEKRQEREEKKEKRENPPRKIEKEDKNQDRLMRLVYEMRNDSSLSNKDKSWRKIGEKFEIYHLTAKKYYEKYEKKLSEPAFDRETIKTAIPSGSGVMPEEIDQNFNPEQEKEIDSEPGKILYKSPGLDKERTNLLDVEFDYLEDTEKQNES